MNFKKNKFQILFLVAVFMFSIFNQGHAQTGSSDQALVNSDFANVEISNLNLVERVLEDPSSLSARDRSVFEFGFSVTPEVFREADQQGLLTDYERVVGPSLETRYQIAPEGITTVERQNIESNYGVTFDIWARSTPEQRTAFSSNATQTLLDSVMTVRKVVDIANQDAASLSGEERIFFEERLGITPEDFNALSSNQQTVLVQQKELERAAQFRANAINNLRPSTNVTTLGAVAGSADPIVFQPLDGPGTGIAGFTDVATATSLAGILKAGYQLLIGIASVLAVVMIFYAGFRYATSVSPGAKSDAKNRILAALGGLLLALSSWLILSTIDDDLVGVDFVFREFKDGKIVFPIVTEQERTQLNNRYGATIVMSANGQHSLTDVGTLLDAGRGDVTGIPTRGDYNPTIKREFPNSNGLEVQMEKTPFRGSDWVTGTTSWFTGPHDTGVSPTERGALSSCNGILRNVPYTFQGVAIRWNYDLTSPGSLGGKKLVVFSPETNKTAYVTPCDWGPSTQVSSGAAIDLTPGACVALGFVREPRTGGSQLSQLTKNEISSCHGKQVYFRFAS